MASLSRRITLSLPLALALAGCTPIKPQGKPLLTPAHIPPHSVGVEVFFIRCPSDDPRLNKQLWNEVDETPFPPESRRLWMQNGFRVGIVAGQIPDVLAELLEVKATDPADAPSQQPTSPSEQEKEEADTNKRLDEAANLAAEPRVRIRQMSLRPAQRSEIIASPVYDEWPVLTCIGGDVSGQTYRQAQGIFALKIANQRDSRVQFELVPELFHGQPRQRWVGEQGVLRLDSSRAKRVFPEMTVHAILGPGQILAMTCLPNRSGSIGHYYFTDKQCGKPEQKLLLVRLMQVQHDDILPASEP